MEAAGIEPASGSLPPFDNYVRSPCFDLGPSVAHGHAPNDPVLVNLADRLPGAPTSQPAF